MMNSFILKVASFCNLNCSYCYMFNLGDFSYLRRPKIMSLDTVKITAKKVISYALSRNLTSANIIFHGGEPLLAGKDWIQSAVKCFEDELEKSGEELIFHFRLQTNGILLDKEWLDLFRHTNIKAGISIDGPKHIHDKSRINHAGHGSYDEVIKGVKLMLDNLDLFTGVLCVIDPEVDGLEIYRHFRELGITRMDFLTPIEYNWDNLPPKQSNSHADATPLADYLIPIFDDWWAEDNPAIRIRLFHEIFMNMLGAQSQYDPLGGMMLNLAVIESDGALEPLDAIRACENGITNVGLDIQNDSIASLHDQPIVRAAMMGQQSMCTTCQKCSISSICGGGYLPHRFSKHNGFDNPSVYCRDLWKIITHVLSAAMERTDTATA